MEAIRGLKQRRLKIHRIVLHEMMASGYDVLPHLEHIKERILRLCRDVDGADDLPDIVLDSFTTDRAVDTVRMNVTALHKVPRRIAFLVAANGRLADLLSEIEDSGKEEAIRTRVLLRLSKSPIQYTNLDKTLRRLIDDTERAV